MTVSNEIETIISRIENFNNVFNYVRNGNVLEFFVNEEFRNPFANLENIIFDYNNTRCFINYRLNNENYSCSTFIRNDNDIRNIVSFLNGIAFIYTSGRGFQLHSQNERTVEVAGILIAFRSV